MSAQVTLCYIIRLSDKLANMDLALWPDVTDVEGAALGIARLWDQYR